MAEPLREGRVDLPPWQPWAAVGLFAFLLHFTWELLQVPFFRDIATAPHWDATRICLLATFGDVAIAELAYGGVALATKRGAWLEEPSARRVALYLGVDVAITAVVELLSVHVWGRWAYAEGMPVILGIGTLPLLQWFLIPPAVLWLARRHLGWGSVQRAPAPESNP